VSMRPGWRRLRSSAVLVAATGCVIAAVGAVIAELISGASTFWALAGAAILAASALLAPMAAGALSGRNKAREALDNIRDARPVPAATRDRSIASLLDPHVGVVPFIGRERERAELITWSNGSGGNPVRLITGGGGVGKTRLALWLERELADSGWLCVWVRDGQEEGAVRTVRDVTHGRVLLIVDYAETRLGLEEMLHATAGDQGDALRILLLARRAGDWWQRLEGGNRIVRAMVAGANQFPKELAQDIDTDIAHIDMVRYAMRFFADSLRVDPPPLDSIIVTGGGPATRVLDLHAAALIAVLAADSQPRDAIVRVDLDKVLQDLLAHEKRYWLGRAKELDLVEGPQGFMVAELAQVVAAGCLLGATDERDAMRLLTRVPRVSPSPKLARWLHELYPPVIGEGWLGSLRPDRLAELHVTSQLDESPELAEACLNRLDERQARRAMILLAQAVADYPAARLFLERALFRFSDAVSGIDAPRDTMITIVNAMPYPSTSLRPARLALINRIIATLEPGTAERAAWLNESAQLLSAQGRREEALAAAKEATGIYRELDPARAVWLRLEPTPGSPVAHLPDLGSSLYKQHLILIDLGLREEALIAIKEATCLYERLQRLYPARFQSDLVQSLYALADVLDALGVRHDANKAREEADRVIERRDAY
jgi:tetratricopeptide (TPR) repeat protein